MEGPLSAMLNLVPLGLGGPGPIFYSGFLVSSCFSQVDQTARLSVYLSVSGREVLPVTRYTTIILHLGT